MPVRTLSPAHEYGLALLGQQQRGPVAPSALGALSTAANPIIGALLAKRGMKEQEAQRATDAQDIGKALLAIQSGGDIGAVLGASPGLAEQFGPDMIRAQMDYASKAPERAENYRQWEVGQVDAAAKDVTDFTNKSLTRRDVANEKFDNSMRQYGQDQRQAMLDSPEYKADVARQTAEATLPTRMQVAQAGRAQTNVNVGPQAKAFDEGVGKIQAERYGEIVKGADAARAKVGMLQAIGPALADAPFAGTLAETMTNAAKLGQQLGISDTDVSGAEVAKSLSNQMAMMQRNPAGGAGMPGAMSDADRNFLAQTVPSLSNTRGGAQKMVELAVKIEQRRIEVADIAQRYIEQNGKLDSGFDQAVKQFAESNPLFSADQPSAAPGAAPDAQSIVNELRRRGIVK